MGYNIVVLDKEHGDAVEDMKFVLDGLCLKNASEIQLKNQLCDFIREAYFAKSCFLNEVNRQEENGSEGFEYLKSQLQYSFPFSEEQNLCLHSTELTYHIKSFAVFSKSLLDRMVPLIGFRYKKLKDKNFTDRGKNLRSFLKKSYEGTNRMELVQTLSDAKEEWLDKFLGYRDDIVHNNSFNNYVGFHFAIGRGERVDLLKISDLQSPRVFHDETRSDRATEYITYIYNNLMKLIKELLSGLNFQNYHLPPFFEKCPSCKGKIFHSIQDPELGCRVKILKSFRVTSLEKEHKHLIFECPYCLREVDSNVTHFIERGIALPI